MFQMCFWVMVALAVQGFQEPSGDLDKITLELRCPKGEFTQDQVVPLVIALKNAPDGKVAQLTLNPALPLGVELYWESPRTIKSRIVFLHERRRAAPIAVELQPGAKIQALAFCSPCIFKEVPHAISEFKLPDIGEWKFWGVYASKNSIIKSEVIKVRITILPSGGGSHPLASESWHRFALGDQRVTKEKINELKDVFRTDRTGAQWDVLGYLLGLNEEENERYEEASVYYRELLAREPTNVAKSQVLLKLGKVLPRLGRYDEALILLDQVKPQEAEGSAEELKKLRNTIEELKRKSNK